MCTKLACGQLSFSTPATLRWIAGVKIRILGLARGFVVAVPSDRPAKTRSPR